MTRLISLSLLSLALIGCEVSHVAPYIPKQRKYETPAPTAAEKDDAAPGSLWRKGGGAAMLFSDARALREQDLVVVKVSEVADAKRSSDTALSRNSELSADLTAFLRAMAATTGPQLDLQLKAALGQKFEAQGSTGRTEQLTATVPALVRKVLPNGNLFIEGHRVVLVNSEEQHFYISGVVRPIDIDQENSVKSSMIADAEIEFTGRGVMTDNQRQGLLARFFAWIWPF
jgi:flagellar L-ring protein precursor FlgH